MIPQPPPSLYVFGPLNFGSALVVNGLIRVLARQNPRVKWLVKGEYIHAVRETIKDLTNVQVLAAHNEEELRSRWLPHCPNNLRLDSSAGDSELYRMAGIPFDARWSEFKFPMNLLRGYSQAKKPIALIYETEKFPVNTDFLPGLAIFRINKRASILDWLPDIFAAQELHFINSAFLHLAESLYAIGALPNTTLVYHRYARPVEAQFELRAPWRIFD